MKADIYISIERIRENAKIFKATFNDELHRVIIHGVLHLLGYTDKTKDEKYVMRALEDEALELKKNLPIKNEKI